MKPVTVYTRDFCGFCMRAKALLEHKGVDFTEINAGKNPAMREEMIQRSNGGMTYPQIFVGDHHVGGCDDLYASERDGQLDALLAD